MLSPCLLAPKKADLLLSWMGERRLEMAKGKYEEWLEPDGLTLLEAWARNGLTDEQLAHNMGIASSTLREWKKNFQAISAALKKGKEVVDIQVENALFQRATGYNYQESTEEWRPNADGELELISKRVQNKHMPPDTTAQIYWLKNRRPDLWRDKPADNVSDSTVRVIFKDAQDFAK